MPQKNRHGFTSLGAATAGNSTGEGDFGGFESAVVHWTAGAAMTLQPEATDRPLANAIAQDDIAAADTEIDLIGSLADKFPVGGADVIINGDTITYTGRTGAQLTGVSGIAAGGHKKGSRVTLAVGDDDRVWRAYGAVFTAGGAGSFANALSVVPQYLRFGAITDDASAVIVEGVRGTE